MSIQSIKSEICQLLNIESISASEAKALKQALGMSSFNWSKTETWEQLLNNIKLSHKPLQASTADDNLNNDVSTIKEVSNNDVDINDMFGFDDLLEPTETIKSVEVKEEVKQPVTVNTELKAKRKLTLYEQIKRENSFATLKTYSLTDEEKQLLKLSSKAEHNQKEDEEIELTREDAAILEASRDEREKCNKYNESVSSKNKHLPGKKQFTPEQIEARLKIRAEKVKAGFKKSDKEVSRIFTELDSYSKALNQVQFVNIATDSQKSVVVKARPQLNGLDGVQHNQETLKEVAGNLDVTRSVRFDRDTETKFRFEQFGLRQELQSLWLDSIEIKDDKYADLLIGQYSEEYRQLVCAYYDWQEFLGAFRDTEGKWVSIRTTTTEEPGEYAGEIETKHETEEKELLTLTELLYEELEYYLKSIDKDKQTATEKKFLAIYTEAKEVVKANLLGKYKLDKFELTLSQWRSICLDNLGKTRDQFLEEIKDLNIKSNPIAVTALLIWQNTRGNESITEVADIDSHAETIAKYIKLDAINRFKELEASKLRKSAEIADEKESKFLLHKAASILNSVVSFSNDRLLINKVEASNDQLQVFSKLLEANNEKIKQWETHNPDVKLTVFKKTFKGKYKDTKIINGKQVTNIYHGLYTLISKTSTKPKIFRAIDEKLNTIQINNNLSLGVIPVSLTSHFADREVNEDVKYKKDLLPNGKNRVSAVNDRKKTHFPEIPLFAKKISNDIMVWIKPSNNHDILAYVDWCDLSKVTPSNPANWHGYGTLKIRKINNISVVEFRIPNKQRNFASNYSMQDGKHTAVHFITMAVMQWGMKSNDIVTMSKTEFQGKELKERPLYCKELCKYLGLHLKPTNETFPHFAIEVVKDYRECKSTNDFKSQNPHLKNVAHNVAARTVVKAVKSAALDKVDNTEKIKERILDEVSKDIARLLHPGIADKEVQLPDGRWLKPKFQFVKGVKTVSSYLVVKREVINVW